MNKLQSIDECRRCNCRNKDNICYLLQHEISPYGDITDECPLLDDKDDVVSNHMGKLLDGMLRNRSAVNE